MANIYYSNERKRLKEVFGDVPYIIHKTHKIVDILATTDLKITPGSENNNNNWNFDEKLPYIYFSLFNANFMYYLRPIMIIFPTSILTKQKFYINKECKKAPTEKAIIETNETKINKLFTKKLESIKPNRKSLFQNEFEVLIEKDLSLKDAFAIVLSDSSSIDNIHNKIIITQNKIRNYDKDNKNDETQINISKKLLKQYKRSLLKNKEIIDFVADNFGLRRINEGPRRAGDPAELVADATRAREALSWTPVHSTIDSIITDAYKWYCNQL